VSVSRSQRVKNMFPAPKTADVVTEDPVVPAQMLLKNEDHESPSEIIEVALDDIVKAEGHIKNDPRNSDSPLIKSDSKPPLTDKKVKKEKKVVVKSVQPENHVIDHEVAGETPKLKEAKIYLGCRVSPEMKNAIEDMSRDFVYVARKEYGIKIKDDTSSMQRAFLLLGMSCFTEAMRHKTLQEYDSESLMQDEISHQLLALMRIHKIEIDDIDV